MSVINLKVSGVGFLIVSPFEINSIPKFFSKPIPKSIVFDPPIPRIFIFLTT